MSATPTALLLRPFRAVNAWIDAPMPVARLEIVRVFAPLAALGFFSGRLIHADEWIGDAGFVVPRLEGDVLQPLHVPRLPSPVAWLVVAAMVVSALMVSAGFRTRASALVFASICAFVALADPLSTFTVTKITPVIMIAVACGPAGSRFGVDAWRRAKRGEPRAPRVAPLAPIRFLQVMVAFFYCASGVAKGGGDWLTTKFLLWSHQHDTYQTPIAYLVAKNTPPEVWTPLQYAVLAFELFAPLWFGLRRTRTPALVFGLGMHFMIGLLFGPVLWFALLMMTLLTGCFLPDAWIARVEAAAERLGDR